MTVTADSRRQELAEDSRLRSLPPDYGSINSADDDSYGGKGDKDGDGSSVEEKSCFCGIVPIEVPVFLYFVAMYITLPVTTFYLNDRLHEKYDLPNRTVKCTDNDTVEQMEDMDETDYEMHLTFLVNFPAILPALFMGYVSDRFGRRISINLVSLATLVKNAVYALVFFHHWPVEYLYIGNVLEGLSGSYGAFLLGAYGIVADVTADIHSRGFKITCVGAAIALGQSVGLSVTGYWIKYTGYLFPVLFAGAVQAFNVVFVLALPHQTPEHPDTSPVGCSDILKSVRVFSRGANTRRRAVLALSSLVFFFEVCNVVANDTIIINHLMAFPFCWDQTHITVFSAVYVLASWALALLAIGCFGRVIRDDVFAFVGALCGVAGFTLQGLARTSSMMYIAGACGALSNLLMPMLRAIMSKAVEATEQGSLFAGIGVLEMMGTTLASVSADAIYEHSVRFLCGFPWLCLAGISALSAVLLGVVIVVRKSDPQPAGFREIEKILPTPEPQKNPAASRQRSASMHG